MGRYARLWSRVGAVIACALPVTAHAGGFELPGWGTRALGRGGAFGVLADDPTAIGINPAGLLRDRGTRLLLDSSLKWQHTTFTGSPFSSSKEAPSPWVPATDNQDGLFPFGGELVIVTDFGLKDWAFAIGAYGPNAHGNSRYSDQGGARYMMTEFDVLLVYYTLSVAWGEPDHFGIGASFQLAQTPKAELSLVIDGTPNPQLNQYNSGFDLLAKLAFADNSPKFSAIVGGWWRVIPQLELGLSARAVPIPLDLRGDVELHSVAGSNLTDDNVTLRNSSVAMDLTMPVWVRGGLRYRHLSGTREVFDLELDMTWENWATLKEYDVRLQGDVEITSGAATMNNPLVPLNIPRAWQDVLSVRLGGTWSAVQDLLWLSAGGFYETGASPEGYEHLDFLSFGRGGAAFGARVSFLGVDITAAYMHVFQETRTNDERTAKIFQQRPLAPCPGQCGGFQGLPANVGTIESSFDVLNISLQLHFDQWM